MLVDRYGSHTVPRPCRRPIVTLVACGRRLRDRRRNGRLRSRVACTPQARPSLLYQRRRKPRDTGGLVR